MSNIVFAIPLVRLFFVTLVGGLFLASSVAQADMLPSPSGPVILTITGAIEKKNTPTGAEFDYEMLAQLGLETENIDTEWTPRGTVFEGVRLRKLMEAVGAKGEWVRAQAANDYSTNIPLTDLTNYDTLLGLSLDGKRMRLRDKGPSWILYSNADRPNVHQSELNKRMIWQLTTLLVM